MAGYIQTASIGSATTRGLASCSRCMLVSSHSIVRRRKRVEFYLNCRTHKRDGTIRYRIKDRRFLRDLHDDLGDSCHRGLDSRVLDCRINFITEVL